MSLDLPMGSYVSGSITYAGQSVRYEFNIATDDDYVICVYGSDSSGGTLTLADPYVQFSAYDGYGYLPTGEDNDSGYGKDPLLVAWAYSGWHAIDVSSYVSSQSGSYLVWYAPKAYVLMGATPGSDANVSGTSSNDVINGLDGNDTMKGGAGDDTYYVDQSGDVVVENASEGNDTIHSSITHALETNVENLSLYGIANINGMGNSLANQLFGNSGNNILKGLPGNDILDGGDGNDTLNGDAGNDSMTGGGGNDTYYVDSSDDVVTADASGLDTVISTVSHTLSAGVENLTLIGSGNTSGTGNVLNNLLIGNAGNNRLTAGDGNDTLQGGAGADTLDGGAGNDIYYIDNGSDVATDAGGIDLVYSSVTYTLPNGFENIVLTGSAAINATGNAAANILNGLANTAANSLTGGAGNDTYILGAGDSVVENSGGGVDLIQAGFSYMLGANQENLTLTGSGSTNGTGNVLNNLLTGNAGNNRLTAGNGNDILQGGVGVDTLDGGAGNDIYYVDNGSDVATDAGGVDLVYSSVTYTLPNEFENIVLTGSAAINATGNAAANMLNGLANTAANSLTGGAGNDTYILGAGDSVVENVGGGVDLIQAGFSYMLGANQENLTLTGSGNTNATGNTLNNLLIGNAGSNHLTAGDGNDTLQGGAGDDYLTGGNGDDLLIGGLGVDTLTGGAGNDTFKFTLPVEIDPHTYSETITDFASGDKIDLASMDANANLTGDQAFSYITGPFTGVAGQLTVLSNRVQGDINGDGNADLYIYCYTSPLDYPWSAADFLL